MARRPNTHAPLRAFKGFGQMRERDGDAKWFPVEFLFYYDDHNRLKKFAYVRREDGGEIADGLYFFLDDLGERTRSWRKWKGNGRSDGAIDRVFRANEFPWACGPPIGMKVQL